MGNRGEAKMANQETENIFLFVPNLIGYGRILLALISFYFMPTNHIVASWCYILSCFLDTLDGYAARVLNQSTKFGAMLDMITDRCATMGLLVTLCTFYPEWVYFFQMSMTIDIACHWIHLHMSLLKGSQSHKFVDGSDNPIMRFYYTNKPFLFTMCAGNELFYTSLYLLHFTQGPFYIFSMMAMVTFPIAIGKLAIALVQGY